MRTLVFLLCFSAAGPALGAKRMTASLFPPHSSEPAGIELGYGIVDVAGAALYQSGAYHHLHTKQILSVARHRGWTSADLATDDMKGAGATLFGASVGAYGNIEKTATGWQLTMNVFQGNRHSKLARSLPADAAAAVQSGGLEIARAIAALGRIELPDRAVHPRGTSGAAMSAYLSCYAVLVRQPMGLRESHVVEVSTLAAARKRCEEAVKLDPGFVDAWAALSLASSLSLQNDRAVEALRKAQGAQAYVPMTVLAEYWLATRFKDHPAGAAVLRKGLDSYPGSLIFLSYLGEHLNITRQFQEALAVWNRYLAAVNQSPYALSQKGYSMARLGSEEDAISLSRLAVAEDPKNLFIELELASRLVDAGQLKEAEVLLEAMVKKPRVFGEVLSRLGYVYLLEGRNDAAEPMLNRALALATGPSEWRTRGRTRYNLAIVMVRRGNLKKSEDQLLAAAEEGFALTGVLNSDKDLEKLKGSPRVAHLFKAPTLTLDPKLLQVSPFLTDSGGILRPDTPRQRRTAPGFRF